MENKENKIYIQKLDSYKMAGRYLAGRERNLKGSFSQISSQILIN